MDIYSHLCLTDVSVKTALIQSAHVPSSCIVLNHGDIYPMTLTLACAQTLSVTFLLILMYLPQQTSVGSSSGD